MERRKKKKLGSYPYISVIISISLALFVIGLFGILLLHTNRLTNLIQENVELQVYLQKNVSDNERIRIHKNLSARDYVAMENEEPKINFIPKKQAANDLINQTGEDFVEFLGENPLRDAFIIGIKPEYFQAENLEEIERDIESMTGVYEIAYTKQLIQSIEENVTKLSLVLLGFAIILIITVTILINNTIKLALFSQRFLIRSMQLVGANPSFIRRPFIYRAALYGLTGGVIASLGLYLLLQYANDQIQNLEQLQEMDHILVLFGILLILGIFLGIISTYRAINKYLRMSLDELY